MSLPIEQTTLSPQPDTATQTSSRVFFIDHIRILLTILVILHHLAITYAFPGPWYIFDDRVADPLASAILTIFVFINQSFFMSFFFLISAYFAPGSYDRKGRGAFLKDRLLRLGVPMIIFALLINAPLTYFGFGASNIPEMRAILNVPYVFLIGPGPLWFVEALLIFVSVYALWRGLSKKTATPPASDSVPPTYRAIILFTLALASITFLVRIWFPFGLAIPFIGFQPGNFPLYIGMFIVGLIAYRRNWFLNIPSSMGKVALGVVIGATLLLFPLAMTDLAAFPGGLHWQASVYALWESIMCVGMSIGLLILFRQRLNRQGNLGKWLATQSYTTYILHAPVIVLLAYVLLNVQLHALLKFVLAALIGIPLCFLAGYLLRKLPYTQKIL